MLSLKKCLGDVVSRFKSLDTKITAKQNKAWKKIGATSGTLSYNASSYTELSLHIQFGGVETDGRPYPQSF